MIAAFLLAFPALFSIVNPVAGAFIFRGATAGLTHPARSALAWQVAGYSLLVMLVALWAGPYLLVLFGISIAALRIAGGVVVALFAWELLGAAESRADRKQAQAAAAEGGEDVAFFPLTLPFTTGPGTIAVAVALGAGHPPLEQGWGGFFAGASAAAAAMAVVIGLTYAQADRLSGLLGRSGSATVSRLSAFLLFCIGVQVLVLGVTDVLRPLLAPN